MRTAFSLGAHAADKKAAQREPRSAPAKSAAKRLPARRNLPSELEQRRASHQQASTRGKADSKSALTPATELIFRLDRRGVGWGEEILPHLTVEQRVLKRNRSAQPDPWAEGSAELFLRDVCGIPEHLVDAVMITAVAWRVTPGGRPLIDRRRRCRCERNMPLVSQYLQEHCNIPAGRDGVGAIFLHVPQLMLCKPVQNDRWDRRVIELAAFWHEHGHCNVPEDYPNFPDLGPWVRRQRVVQQQGTLSEQRVQILDAIGFDFGNEAQITEEWEMRFDQLVDWLLWKEGRVGNGMDWTGLELGPQGGLRAREVVLWSQQQREFRRRSLLPEAAIRRLDAIGFCWDPKQGKPADVRWMSCLGSLLYVMERQKKAMEKQVQANLWLQQRLTRQAGEVSVNSLMPSDENSSVRWPLLTPADARDLMVWASDSPVMLKKGFGIWATHTDDDLAWVQKEVPRRSAALAEAPLEPGQETWLARQRWLWRHGRLAPEQSRLLRLAGVEMVMGTADQWRDLAHEAAFFMHGCSIGQGLQELEDASLAALQEEGNYSCNTASDKSPEPAPAAKSPRLYPELVLPKEALLPSTLAEDRADLTKIAAEAERISVPAGTSRKPGASALTRILGPDLAAPAGLIVAAKAGMVSYYSLPVRKPGRRLAVRRWVQNARALWRENRLSEVRFRYMTMLGLSWVLRDEAFLMGNAAWGHCLLLLARPPMDPLDEPLRQWLCQQRALGTLGLLDPIRAELLSTFVADWLAPPSREQQEWDAHVTQLLAFRRTHRHTRVSDNWPPAPQLAEWLAFQRQQWRSGRLAASRSAQLEAIGVDFVGP